MLISSEIGVNFMKRWIYHHTAGMTGVAELGAGHFDKLSLVHHDVARKAGLEIHPAALESPQYTECQRILGDMREYRSHVNPAEFPCVMLIDSLEHIGKADGIKILRQCQSDFHRVLVMTPEGVHPQGALDGNPHQEHRSTWYAEDFYSLGFPLILVYPYFHNMPGKSRGAIFARWDMEL